MAVFVTGITPAAATGLGPHAVTIEGSGFPLTPNGCQILLKDSAGEVVGQSAPGTAASDVAFAAPIIFTPFTPSGDYIPYLVADGIGYAGAPAFTLTRNTVTLPPAGTLTGKLGEWVPGNFPANRPKSGGRSMGRR